ncbi:hypothetical protein FNV43_RR13983 [Rhamnella rubrinervis]|uniref:non-specific serine/threonine protein kinase n=1 Tax=Rhamnella rubrinervis TaxID=2594499 RepID=A0A8K0MFZ8_9ROSA|nr:hypothetical protein FNV43_RR13983 [Rhamnella rubrinervis]
MHHHLSRNVFFLLMVSSVVLILIHGPSSSSADDYSDCGKLFECGDVLGIGYPFWGSSRPSKCGHPNFHLKCIDNVPQISIFNEDYLVLHIDNTTHTIKAVRADYQRDVCPGTEFHNTTMDTGLFNYTSATEELRLFYTCSSVQQFTSVPNQFDCSGTVNYFFTHDQIAGQSSFQPNGVQVLLGDCEKNVWVRVFRSEAMILQVTTGSKDNLIRAVSAGFNLSWNANNTLCDDCLRNNNRCGYKHASNQFACYLPGIGEGTYAGAIAI